MVTGGIDVSGSSRNIHRSGEFFDTLAGTSCATPDFPSVRYEHTQVDKSLM